MDINDVNVYENIGVFSGFVLLAQKQWDKEQFKKDFAADWGLNPKYDEGEGAAKVGADCDAVIMEIGSQKVAIGYMGMPVPGREAEKNAAYNYTWKEAADVVKTHQAQILVMVMGDHEDVKKDGELFVKVVATLCNQKGALGVYTNEVVYQPEFYFAMKEFMEKGMYPVLGLVWFHVLQAEYGYSVYTVGMNNFGKDEMEIIGTAENPKKVKDFLVQIASYVIEEDVTIRGGETIGVTAEQKCQITRSNGVYVEGMSLKIEYQD